VFFVTTLASGAPGQGGTGSVTLGVPLPNDPTLQNGLLAFQWLVVDAGDPQGLAASQGFEVRLCP
jgi:hypothetical protein